MRIVTASEAVAEIRSGEQLYLHCAAATPSVLLDALVARVAEHWRIVVVRRSADPPTDQPYEIGAGKTGRRRLERMATPA